MQFQISLLAAYPQFIDSLAPWIWRHWQPLLPDDTLQSRIAKLRLHLNTDSLPIAWVAHQGAEVYGTAALRVHDLPGHEQLTPWLGGVFVAETYRRQGIGSALCAAVEAHASQKLGMAHLYLFTLDQQRWYQQQGWQPMQACTWCDRPGDIMIKHYRRV